MAPKNLYDILEVHQSATTDEIKNAYRRLAMKWHPDRNPANKAKAEERFKEIGYAYKVLSDPQQRKDYDEHLASQKATGAEQEREESFDTGMSEDDASKMFFEQMIDLAYELARRGFDETKILKMLLALDCPEMIAKTVARIATTSTRQNQGNGGGPRHQNDENLDALSPREYADFGARLGAAAIDGVVVMAFALPLFFIFYEEHLAYQDPLYGLVSIAIGWLYSAIGESSVKRATWGKRALGLKVSDLNGDRISFARASGRHFGRYISMATLYIGYLIQPFTKKRQTLHDIMTGTVVTRVEDRGNWIIVVVVLVPIVSILSAIAIPAYQGYTTRAQVVSAVDLIEPATSLATDYMIKHEEVPKSLHAVSYFASLPDFVESVGITYQGVVYARFSNSASPDIAGKRIGFFPTVNVSNKIEWVCGSPNIDIKYLPSNCSATILPDGVVDYLSNRRAIARQAATERAQRQRLDAAIAEMESRYPVLNPNSPSYNQQLVNELIKRTKAYISQGIAPAIALRFAISDMERGG